MTDRSGDDARAVERRDVWALSREDEWHPVIAWYGRSVRHLRSITDVEDPRSWVHLANIHGTFVDERDWPASVTDRGWNACQHGSWYFLPWHRIYLHHFETIVRAAVVELGGPADWALPFWHYDPTDRQTLCLPPAFRQPRTPDGEENALFDERRRPAVNQGEPVPAERVETSGWSDRFTAPAPRPSFGGPPTGWSHTGRVVGDLELEPHGLVHVEVGGSEPPGLMSLFETAAQDPVFWLHHANIDRCWEVWRNGEGHANPTQTDWTDRRFDLGTGEWQTSLLVSDVIDTTASPLRYRYEGVPVPPVREVEAFAVAMTGDENPPELVGATEAPVPLTDAPSSVGIPVAEPVGPEAALAPDAGGASRRVYLVLENVTGTSLGAGAYAVHVDVPEGADPRDFPDRHVGRFSTFGVMEASRPDASGLTFSFDVTDVVRRLEAGGERDPAQLRVTISPEGSEPAPGTVRVGRVGVYHG